MSMQQIDIKKLRTDYETISSKIANKEFDKKFVSLISQSKLNAEKQREAMIATDQYAHLEESNAYIEKYNQLENLIQMKKKNQVNSADFVSRSKLLFPGGVADAGARISRQSSTQSMQNDSFSQPRRDNSPNRAALNNFFDIKTSSLLKPKNGLASIVQTPQIHQQPFRKRIGEPSQYQSLLQQNKYLQQRLQNIKSERQSITRLQTVYKNNQYQLQTLEKERSQLTLTNLKLKSQTSSLWNNSGEEVDYLYSPYTINIRRNDIYQINSRNYQRTQYGDFQNYGSQLEQEPVQVEKPVKNHVQYRKVGYQYDTYTEQDYKNQKDNINYSIFDINRSYLSQTGSQAQPDPSTLSLKTLTSNKLAFFKQKGILLRTKQLQIGYKRSEMNDNQNGIRVILYLNNKTGDYKKINIAYDYKQDYFQLAVKEKIRELNSFRQGREVVEVCRRGNRDDLNQIVEVFVQVDEQKYNILLPVMFFKIGPNGYAGGSSDKEITRTVEPPLKAFSTPTQAIKVIQSLNMNGKNEGQFWVESPVGNGPVKLQWNQGRNSVNVTTNKKWLSLLTLLMYGGE